MDIGQWTVIVLSALFVAWFFNGTAKNRKLGDQVLRWVQGGTSQLGRVSEARRIRGSAVQFSMKDAAAPFRKLDLTVTLESRENPPLWLYDRLKGKRDELVIQGTLRNAPQQEFEITRVKTDLGAAQEMTGASMPKMLHISSGTYALTSIDGIDPGRLELLEQFLSKYSDAVQRLTLKRSAPHLMVRLKLTPLLETTPQDFIKDLQGLIA